MVPPEKWDTQTPLIPPASLLNFKPAVLPENELVSSQHSEKCSYKEKDPVKALYVSITSKSDLKCVCYQGPWFKLLWLKEKASLSSQPGKLDLSPGLGDRRKSIFLGFFGSIKPETYFAWHFSSGSLNPCALYGK